jgi:choline dehydrogenase
LDAFDYIIVGAGSAGCVLARRLSDDPGTRVLLLEAGGPATGFWVRTPAGVGKLFLDPRVNWSYFTEPVPTMANRRIYWPRGKVLGGSSSINAMVYLRGHPKDFDHWRSQGAQGWGWDDVLPYFKRLEHNERGGDSWRGTDGPLCISDPVLRHPTSVAFVEAARRTGIPYSEDLNGALHDGVGFLQHNIRNGERHSAWNAYVEPVRDRPNLVVRSGAHVLRVVFEGREATGVEVLEGSHRRVIAATREVIVSAGTLNSPQLLMLSGVGDGSTLQEHGIATLVDLPGVGRNLQDHFYVHTEAASTAEASFNRELTGLRKYWHGAHYLARRKGYLAISVTQVAAFTKSRPQEEYANLQISFRPMTFNFRPSGKADVDPHPAISTSVYCVRPASRGYVGLRSSDPLEAPVLVPNYLTHPDDARATIAGIRQIRAILATEPMASLVKGELAPGDALQSDEQLQRFLETHGTSCYHPVGTCRMGQDPLGVVDARLRVHGVQRLRVIDASIMPRLTSGNTNAASIMIGEKGADLVLQDRVPRRTAATAAV